MEWVDDGGGGGVCVQSDSSLMIRLFIRLNYLTPTLHAIVF